MSGQAGQFFNPDHIRQARVGKLATAIQQAAAGAVFIMGTPQARERGEAMARRIGRSDLRFIVLPAAPARGEGES